MTESKETQSENFIDRLPQEIVELILLDKQLELEDVLNFSFTCKKFNLFNRNSKVWKIKSCEKWPTVRDDFWLLFANKTRGEWQKVALSFLIIKANLMNDIRDKSKHICLKMTFGLNDLFNYLPSFDIKNSLQVPIMIDELAAYLDDPSNTNLSHCYHAKLMFLFLKRKYLSLKYYEVLSKLPSEELTVETFMVFQSKWSNINEHDISQTKIFSMLNDIARRVEENLKKLNPSHSLFKVGNSTREEWKTKNIEGNQFSSEESRQVLLSMFDILFGELGFTVSNWAYNSFPVDQEKNYSCLSINKVLENKIGYPIVVSAIFMTIARRFGVVCEYSSDDTLHWKDTTCNQKPECFAINFNLVQDHNNPIPVLDTNRKNLVKSCHGQCKHKPLSLRQIGFRLTLKVVSNEVDIGAPVPISCLFTSSTLPYCNNLSGIVERPYDRVISRRLPRDPIVKYAVGMIVQYENKNGAITAWFYEENCVPRYNILVKDLNYVKMDIQQGENITCDDVKINKLCLLDTTDAKEIDNKLIGKYFSEFKGLYYQPQDGLEKIYPDDYKVRELYVQSCLKNANKKGETI